MNCKICNKYFSGIDNFRQHEVSEKHKRKVELHKYMNPGNSEVHEIPRKEVASCPVCSKTFYDHDDFIQHIMSEEHAQMVIKKSQEYSEDGLAAKDSLPSGMESMKNDLCTGVIQSPNESLLVSSSILPSYSKCDTCQKIFTGPEPYQQHIESAAHKKKCGSLGANSSVASPSCGSLGANLSVASPSLSVTNSALKCELCVMFFTGPESYNQHMESVGHLKKELISSNNVNIVPNSNSTPAFMTPLKCDICNKTFTGPINLDQHMSSETHKKVVEKHRLLSQMNEGKENDCVDGPADKIPMASLSLSAWHCEICDIPCSGPEPWKQHIASAKHQKKCIARGKESNIEAIKKLLSGDSSCNGQQPQQFPSSITQVSKEDCNGINTPTMTNNLDDEIQTSIFSNKSYIKNIIPSNLDIAIFKIEEDIDFDKNSSSHIEIRAMEMGEGNDNDIKVENEDDSLLDDEDMRP